LDRSVRPQQATAGFYDRTQRVYLALERQCF